MIRFLDIGYGLLVLLKDLKMVFSYCLKLDRFIGMFYDLLCLINGEV